jgi:hypothetical protein
MKSPLSLRLARMGAVAIAITLICTYSAHAQQALNSAPIAPLAPIQSRQLPVPVARANGSNDIEPATTGTPNADTHTLSSIESLGLGSIGVLTNYLDPSVRFTQSGSNTVTPTWDGISAIGANLDFADHGSHSHLSGYYRGSQVLYFSNPSYNSGYHNLGIAEEYSVGRWLLRIREDFLSSTQVGLGGVDLTGVPSSVGTSLMYALQPSADITDTILTARAKRLHSITSAEINYAVSRRSTVTVTGSYTSSTYSTAGFVDTHRTSGRIGYDYLLSAKDAIGIFYEKSQIGFGSIASSLRTDSVQLAFGRRLTGRLAFQISGGPMRVSFGTGNQLNWAVSNSLVFQMRRTQYMLTYAHTAAGGSGIFTGATAHTVSASVHYDLSRWWALSDTTGYSYNQSLAVTPAFSGQIGTWYDTAALMRVIGRHMRFDLNYGFQKQNGAAGVCASGPCDPTPLHQTLGATLEWHPLTIGPR